MKERNCIALAAVAVALSVASTAAAITTSLGQNWTTTPDAWVRGNTADASWFGWDVLEGPQPPQPNAPFGSYKLDDSTPDVGGATTALSTKVTQTPASLAIYGHRSSGGNYYSGFLDTVDGFPASATADDVFSATTPASGTGGFTTVVLQVISQPGTSVTDLTFTIDASTTPWTQQKNLQGPTIDGSTVYWQEWTAPGNDLAFAINMKSPTSSRALDAFQVDTFWSSGASPVVNAISKVGVPEPASATLVGLAATVLLTAVRRRRQNA